MFLKTLIWALISVVTLQQCTVMSEDRKHVICYHGTWSTYRLSLGKFDVSTDIDPTLCTHLMYAFFGIESNTGALRIIDPYLDLEDNSGRGNIRKFNALKVKNPTLKTLMAVGGWNEGSKKFSIVAADPQKRATFVESVVQFIQRHGFDGLDLDWEYPNQRHSLPDNNDRENYITFLKELKEGLEPFGYILSAAVGSAEFSAELSYDIPEISKYLDIINVMAYDLHGPWDKFVGINAPLYAGPTDTSEISKQLNVDAIVKYWINQGAPRSKLVIGVPFYGRSFTLKDPKEHNVGAANIGRGLAGQYSVEPGVIGYNELCEKFQIEKSRWNLQWEPQQMVPYAYYDTQWIGYENERSIALKVEYIKKEDLAGVMIWSIESDDFRGTCGGTKYPLLHAIYSVLYDDLSYNDFNGEENNLQSEEIKYAEASKGSKSPSSQSSSPSANTNDVCLGQNGYIRDNKDCAKFYFCNNGLAFNFDCPPSLYFDLVNLTCNYSHLVEC